MSNTKVASLSDKKKYLNIASNALKVFDKFINNDLIYVYKNKSNVDLLTVEIKKGQFMHLTGLAYPGKNSKGQLSASDFYKGLKNSKLAPEDLIIRNSDIVSRKMSALQNFSYLFQQGVLVIPYEIREVNAVYDRGLSSSFSNIAVGLRKVTWDYLRVDIRSLQDLNFESDGLWKDGLEVIGIFTVDCTTCDKRVIFRLDKFESDFDRIFNDY
ncbi:PBECR4 domain-containing protein [Weissella confusa]|uniref:PBECR4 domain-containing protein n=1 Tax=Weissella confusa TaxID=1583 RepID=UPI00107F67CE|nr:PBECR4 domain-containing protein [Weissella confusa]TGE72354.1 hypothetical protein C6P10_10695 [Weissella confusa]